jgi:methionine biosynthesis protein MetW
MVASAPRAGMITLTSGIGKLSPHPCQRRADYPARMASTRSAREYAYDNPRPDVHQLVPEDAARILDLGCSTGAMGAVLKGRRGAQVVGVESDRVRAQTATDRLDQVIERDLEELAADADALRELGSFDCLIAGDVLEHLRDPWSALRAFAGLLRPGGTAVISLPNVRHWETVWQLVARGRWPRRNEGIFDRGHLRWFTVADGLDLVKGAGLEPARVNRIYRIRPSGPSLDPATTWPSRTPLRPFLTFQFLIEARRPANR